MAVTIYASLDQLKARLGLRTTDERSDEELEGILEEVSRAIDDEVNTRFYVEDTPETRYFTASRRDLLLVDDFLSITSIATDHDGDGTFETSWAVSDFLLGPLNAAAGSLPRPYWHINIAELGANWFPIGLERGVRIVGEWGFSRTVPKVVESVCLRESVYAFAASKTPYGMTAGDGAVVAPPPVGGLSKLSQSRLGRFKRVAVA